ncbi:hypothetical protein NQ317_003241 [Molorchus minor]|uniref:Uncharacterized protein n=1 Tax=Molorchus minor TaxID=1323400 RepID=A0ABQ9J649_9CUCU|nr:hypothetical protein NQ317_003241 [Molorchus minor]
MKRMNPYQMTSGNNKRKQNRRFVVGGNSNENAGVQTVSKLISLHETRLNPSSKPNDLKNMLVNKFPEVICEEHTSKFPELYASMKVTIRQDHFKMAWRLDLWPGRSTGIPFSSKEERNLKQKWNRSLKMKCYCSAPDDIDLPSTATDLCRDTWMLSGSSVMINGKT